LARSLTRITDVLFLELTQDMATPELSVGTDEDDPHSEVAINYSSDEDEGPVVSVFLSSSWQSAYRYFCNQAIDDSQFAINYDSDEEEGPLVSASLSSLLFIVTNRSSLFPKPVHRGRGGRQTARLLSRFHCSRLP
jgi:arylamine N-acetyltransferase